MGASSPNTDSDRTRSNNPLRHMGLAVSIARDEWKRIPNRYCTYEDYEQTAFVGLLDACKRYDPSVATFSTFADRTIRGHIKHLRGPKRIVRFGCEGGTGAIRKGLSRGHIEYTREFISQRMAGIKRAPLLKTEEDFHRAVGFVRGTDIAIEDIRTSGSLLPEDILPDDTYPENLPYDSLVGEDWTRVLETYQEKVEREGVRMKKLILEKRLFVLDPEDRANLADIGREMGVSRERVRQIEAVMRREIRLLVKELR